MRAVRGITPRQLQLHSGCAELICCSNKFTREINQMKHIWTFAGIFVGSILIADGAAQAQQKQANIKAGQEISLFYVCKYNGGSAALAGSAANGTVRTDTRRSSQCSGNGEITRIYYKPAPGFRGRDIAYIYYQSQRWDIMINVQ